MAIQTFPQENPSLQKIATRLNLSGAGNLSPILAGLAGRFSLSLNPGEELLSWRIYSGDSTNPDFENVLPAATDGSTTSAEIIFGVDTDTSDEGRRNYIEWITNRGHNVKAFYVINLPPQQSLYIAGQEAQLGEAFFLIGSGEPITFGINILPNIGDEFFRLHEYFGNRFANTLRGWGGASTAEVFLNTVPIIGERYIGDIHGYYWDSPPEETTTVTVRVRAALGSPHFVDIAGTIRVEYA